jgi:phosphatidylserine/phosphatidylglycerophosphate/cardiolipin synthase-like enzyme
MPVDCEKTEGSKAFQTLAETPSVEIRVKQESFALMHLKSYEIDGHVLRTGAANFSASGLKREACRDRGCSSSGKIQARF